MNERSNQNLQNIITTLDLPKDLFLGMPSISLCGNREIYISNHKGILSYGQEEMVILIKDYQLHIKGKSLSIISYSKDDLTIQGYIRSMEFE